ncbi:MAG: Glucokinase [candidate division WS2 bacterium ADurb.Bin280]|uniref:Glucokinase n=1 Tax=candidate division WS2 bacterium ADurb.Bin280 TaxID=1852829 RepID=A0A1V5SFG2_9BACT|nr:MAG: Glucokinase [candidate division WS2 bacterium ADurb.Bin280]
MNEEKIAVIDIGGTNIKFAVIGAQDRAEVQQFDTPKQKDELLNSIKGALEKSLIEKIKNVVLGIPGLVDYDQNKVIFCPNLKELKDQDLKDLFKEKGLNAYFANDADLFLYGATNGNFAINTLALTIGTGLGGSFCLGGAAPDQMGLAGEIGHMKIVANGRECGCGQKGCAEAYVSATALIKQAQKEISTDVTKAYEVFDLARQGNEKALFIIEEMAKSLGLVIANMINVCAVEKIIIGGGIAKSSGAFIQTVKDNAIENTYCAQERKIDIFAQEDFEETVARGAKIFFQRNYDRT